MLARLSRTVDDRRRELRLLVALLAAASAVAMFLAVFVLTAPVGEPFDQLSGEGRSVTLWEAGLRTQGGGSYGWILRILAPAAMAVAFVTGRWWRAALAATTAYSIHWIGSIAEQFENDMAGAGDVFWIFQATRWSDVALAASLVVGCLLLFSATPARQADRSGGWETACAVTALILLSFTWTAQVMVLEGDPFGDGFGWPAGETGTPGPLSSFPLNDLGAVAEFPLRYSSRYLPVVLIVLVVVAMLSGSRRRNPGLRVEVWLGFALAVVADVVQRAPLWYDPSLGGLQVEQQISWQPHLPAVWLLVAAAAAFVLAGWLAKESLDLWREHTGADDVGPPPLAAVEVWSLE